jgi:hypothetical protein
MLIFVKKNWLNDARVGCKAPFSVVALIEFEVHFKTKLYEFERSIEGDELKEDYFCVFLSRLSFKM